MAVEQKYSTTDMTKLTRKYYTISKAAELLGKDEDYLLHLGATGKIPVYILAKGWDGMIFDNTYLVKDDNGYKYDRKPERTRLHDLVGLFEGTVQLFEEGTEAITINSLKLSANPESGKTRQADLDVPVVINKSQLFMYTCDIKNIADSALTQETDHIDACGVNPVLKTVPTEVVTSGLDKHDIALAFKGVHFNRDQWIDNLPNRPKWLVGEKEETGAIVVEGKPGRGGNTLWNPAKVAIQLYGQSDKYLPALITAFRENESLAPWVDEWKAFVEKVAWYTSV